MQEKIYLRRLSLKDVTKKYLLWVNDESITRHLEIAKQHFKYEDLIKYVEESDKKGRYNYAVVTKSSKYHIGNASIYAIDTVNKNFEIGWFIGKKKFWGGHYSSMIIFYLLKIGFIEMGLKKCLGGIEKENIKARLTNKFMGFKETKTSFIKKSNKKISFINVEITKNDWLLRAKILSSQYPKLFDEC